jgi:internalin A
VQKPAGAAALQSVTELDASGVFDDVSPLAGLTQLQKLRIGLKPTQGFASLGMLTKLVLLEAPRANIGDLAPVAGMEKLRFLSVAGNQISDLTPLQALPKLQYVVLVDNQVQDLAPLVKNANLATNAQLFVEKNPFDCATQAANLALLQGRGVNVASDCQ